MAGSLLTGLREKIRQQPIITDYTIFNGLAVLIGIACGFIAIGFRQLIWITQNYLYHQQVSTEETLYTGNNLGYLVILIPAIGGLIVGLLSYYLAREVKGHGVPEVMEAVAKHGGRIRKRVVAVKALASAVTIGSGGSAGREGPIVQIGSATGSSIGQMLGLSEHQIKTLLACGAAGGIAATFNTPIAGVIFALELILIEFRTRSFIPIVISSVFATVISRAFLGNQPAFLIPLGLYRLASPYELIYYLLLGVIAGIVAIIFITTLYKTEDLFEQLRIPGYLAPAFGGAIIGIIGLICFKLAGDYYIFGVGYETVDKVLNGTIGNEHSIHYLFIILFALSFLKVIATSITIGSGGSGGVFAPSLFIGAMVGGAFGILVNHYSPFETASYGAYALVGMAAVFAGASRATLTAIIILFEMTGEYKIILPLMFACVVSDAIGAFVYKETIYTKKLIRRGVRIQHDMEINIMEAITVKEAMTEKVETVSEEMSIADVSKKIQETGHMGFPVVDKKGKLCGIITHEDVKRNIIEGKLDVPVCDLETRDVIVAFPDETLADILRKIGTKDISHFPVVDKENPKMIVGFLTKGNIIKAYDRKFLEKTHEREERKIRIPNMLRKKNEN